MWYSNVTLLDPEVTLLGAFRPEHTIHSWARDRSLPLVYRRAGCRLSLPLLAVSGRGRCQDADAPVPNSQPTGCKTCFRVVGPGKTCWLAKVVDSLGPTAFLAAAAVTAKSLYAQLAQLTVSHRHRWSQVLRAPATPAVQVPETLAPHLAGRQGHPGNTGARKWDHGFRTTKFAPWLCLDSMEGFHSVTRGWRARMKMYGEILW